VWTLFSGAATAEGPHPDTRHTAAAFAAAHTHLLLLLLVSLALLLDVLQHLTLLLTLHGALGVALSLQRPAWVGLVWFGWVGRLGDRHTLTYTHASATNTPKSQPASPAQLSCCILCCLLRAINCHLQLIRASARRLGRVQPQLLHVRSPGRGRGPPTQRGDSSTAQRSGVSAVAMSPARCCHARATKQPTNSQAWPAGLPSPLLRQALLLGCLLLAPEQLGLAVIIRA
jgi:hypothetical protein